MERPDPPKGRPGPKPKPEEERHSRALLVTFTPEELARVDALAQAAGVKRAVYIRERALGVR